MFGMSSECEGRLIGPHVMLAPVRSEDAEELWQLIEGSRKNLERWIPYFRKIRTLDDVRKTLIGGYQLCRTIDSGRAWTARNLETNCAMGIVAWQTLDFQNRSTSAAYWLGQDFEGQGFASEALLLTVAYAKSLGLHRIDLSIDEENTRSLSLAQRCGFVLEGILRDVEWLDGKFHSHRRFARILGKAPNLFPSVNI